MTARLASRLGCTEGQVYTMATGGLLAVLLAFAAPHGGALVQFVAPPPAAGGVPTASAGELAAAIAPTTVNLPAFTVPRTTPGRVPPHGAVGPAPAAPPVTAPAVTSTTAPPVPSVAAMAWARRLSGTPLAAVDEVPPGTLPVAVRLGQHDKVSFIRFDVQPRTLVLTEAGEGARLAESASIAACAATTAAWSSGDDLAFADAPEWDAARCVTGEATDGTWRFETGSLDAPNGVAIVPAPDALDFQVTFERDVEGEP